MDEMKILDILMDSLAVDSEEGFVDEIEQHKDYILVKLSNGSKYKINIARVK